MPITKLDQQPSEAVVQKIADALKTYNYGGDLTPQLDQLFESTEPLTDEDVFRVVLWKLNRYPILSPELLQEMNDLRGDPTEEGGRALLLRLLKKPGKNGRTGFDLPMASTMLRFLAPKNFQIIDQRVYRLVTPGKDRLVLTGMKPEDKVNLYFGYLKLLREMADAYGIEFQLADRIFYEYDRRKDVNGNIPIHGTSTNSQ